MIALKMQKKILLVLISRGEKDSMNNGIAKIFFDERKIYCSVLATVPSALFAGKANKD